MLVKVCFNCRTPVKLGCTRHLQGTVRVDGELEELVRYTSRRISYVIREKFSA